jgi:hypothetical protein
MARDAIARQYDVDKNAVRLDISPVKANYQEGAITFAAKKGKSLDLDKLRESLWATRLSGGTRMQMNYLEITVRGDVVPDGDAARLHVAGTGQRFALAEDPSAKPEAGGPTPYQRLRQALARGEKVVSVTGHVHGWSGYFPDVLKTLAAPSAGQAPAQLLVTDFQTAKE